MFQVHFKNRRRKVKKEEEAKQQKSSQGEAQVVQGIPQAAVEGVPQAVEGEAQANEGVNQATENIAQPEQGPSVTRNQPTQPAQDRTDEEKLEAVRWRIQQNEDEARQRRAIMINAQHMKKSKVSRFRKH